MVGQETAPWKRASLALDQNSAAAVLVLGGGRWLFANAEALQLLAAPGVGALQTKPFTEFLATGDQERIPRLLQELSGTEAIPLGEFHLRRVDGTEVRVHGTGAATNFKGQRAVQLTLVAAAEPATSKAQFREEFQHAIRNHAPFGGQFFHLEPDNRLVFDGANPAADRILGQAHESLIGQPIETAFPALSGTELPAIYRRIARAGGTHHQDRIEYQDEAIHRAYEIHAFQTGAEHVAVFFTDITQRKRAEELLRASEGRYRTLVEQLPQKVFLKDQNLVFISCNSHFAKELGVRPEEIVGKTDFDLCPKELAEKYQAQDREVLAGGVAREFDDTRWINGAFFTTHTVKTPVTDAQGRGVGVLGISWDVTERRRAEQLLKEREEHFRSLIEQSSDLIAIVREDGAVTYIGPSVEHLLGYRPEDLIERNIMTFIHPDDQAHTAAALQRALERPRQVHAAVLRWRHQDGAWRVIEAAGRMLSVDAAGRLCVVVNARDITDRKRAEDALRKSEASLATAQRLAHLGSWEMELENATDFSRNPLRWSDETYRIFGYEPGAVEVSRSLFLQAVHPEDRERLQQEGRRQLAQGQRNYELEHRIVRPDGSVRLVVERTEVVWNDTTHQPVRLVGSVQDITEHKILENQLRQAQKMEAIGQLAGGVAHDFNNILTVIQGNTGLLQQESSLPDEAQELLRQIAVSADRAAHLTRQLLAFSRQQVMQIRTLDLNEVLGNILKMLRRLLGEHIVLQCHYAAQLPPVRADAAMLEQVIINLAINARDAMPKGGQLTIRTTVEEVGPERARENSEAREGRFVALTVSDTGCGIQPADLAHIFEPFFTTKEVGKGTGLGLATVYGIVKQHDGWLEITSQPSQGATFQVFLPVGTVAPAPVAAEPAPQMDEHRGHETILVVEDEDLVRQLILTCLSRCGYQVIEAASGRVALQLWERHPTPIDLLLTDMVMPEGISGRELAEQLRRLNPRLKVVFSSGYNREMIEEGQAPMADEFFLTKPYSPATLTRTVRECLDHRV